MIAQLRQKFSLALILSLLLGSATPTHCLCCLPKQKHIIISAAALAVATMFIFFNRIPGTYKLKFNKAELDKAYEDQNVKEILKQSTYYLSDLIGCAGKGSTVKIVKEDEKLSLDVRPGADPVGLGGQIHYYLFPATKAIKFFISLAKFQETVADSVSAMKLFAGYDLIEDLD